VQHDPPTPVDDDLGVVVVIPDTVPTMDRLNMDLVDASAGVGRSGDSVPVVFTARLATLDGEPTTHILEYRGAQPSPHSFGVGAVEVTVAGDVDGWDHGEFTPIVAVLDELLTTWLEGVDLEDEDQLLDLESRVLDWLQAQADTLIDHGQRAFEDRLGYERTEPRPPTTGEVP
jgi:hypothetical protein